MKTKLRILAVALIAGGTMFAQPRLSVGIGVGGYGPGYYPPPAYAQYQPPCPGPDYTWVDGYWGPQGGRNIWFDGYWRRPYASGYRVAPRYVEPRYYNSFRGFDRDRGFGNRYQSRGGERYESRGHDNRGRAYSNGFRR
jgi:hypothetical protein